MKYNGPKVRISRALGIPLTPKAARIMERKPNPPGEHGAGGRFRRARTTDYKRQLVEKQKLRAQYNIHERQMRNYYRKASKQTGNTADNLIQHLERRLDAMVLRGGLAKTIYAARQYVSHKHITVNGRVVNIASYQVSVGDVVAVREKSQKIDCFTDALSFTSFVPPYLEQNADKFSVKLLAVPIRDEVPVICEMAQVIEYYSRR